MADRIVFSEHAVERFIERAAPGLDREAARARLEALSLTRTGVPSSKYDAELVLLGMDSLVGVLDPKIGRVVTVYLGDWDLVAGLRAAVFSGKRWPAAAVPAEEVEGG